MGIQQTETRQHWNYLLSIEEDLFTLFRFVEPTESNMSTHSLELARILFSASSEVDVVAKLLCNKLASDRKAKNIDHYRQIITDLIPRFYEVTVHLPRYGLTLTPWENWGGDENPSWWKAYNKVKHERNEHFKDANLKNTLNSVAALYVMLLFYYQEEAEVGRLSPNPRLLTVGEPFILDSLHYETERMIVYKFDNFS
ncbi:hypothetical protein [Marinomonas sp. FW-1]|uniref:hypothetical protein n=1 Tax=Marinomonas sp. FW-1 TaxID=2071621 RepID=UPI0010C10698|nr:hypothetical protein [Marinomonas sp. FW-1]